MTQISKPTTLNRIWASSGDKAAPLDSKIQTGWQAEIPPRQWFNWLDNRQDQAIAHINQHGICVWDATTEYQAGKSYVQGQTSGKIFVAVTTHSGINPDTETTSTNWKLAFSSIEVATAAEAQALTTNDRAITPYTLSQAFLGSNRQIGNSGYQRLPGGLILQWFTGNHTAGKNVIQRFNFPITFPSNVLQVVVSENATVTNRPSVWAIIDRTPTGFDAHWTFGDVASTTTDRFFSCIAIGY